MLDTSYVYMSTVIREMTKMHTHTHTRTHTHTYIHTYIHIYWVGHHTDFAMNTSAPSYATAEVVLPPTNVTNEG
jgi:hypothetical protein